MSHPPSRRALSQGPAGGPLAIPVNTQLGKPAPTITYAVTFPELARASSGFWEGWCYLGFCKRGQASSCLAALLMVWAVTSWGPASSSSQLFCPKSMHILRHCFLGLGATLGNRWPRPRPRSRLRTVMGTCSERWPLPRRPHQE